ncbi:hypothetical protein GVAV_002548 [Gurleya vavrai]
MSHTKKNFINFNDLKITKDNIFSCRPKLNKTLGFQEHENLFYKNDDFVELLYDFSINRNLSIKPPFNKPQELRVYHSDPDVLHSYFLYLHKDHSIAKRKKNFIEFCRSNLLTRFCIEIKPRSYKNFFSVHERMQKKNEELFPGYLYFNNDTLMFYDLKQKKIYKIIFSEYNGLKCCGIKNYINVTVDEANFLVIATFALQIEKDKNYVNAHKVKWPMIACLRFNYPRYRIKN